MKSLKTVVTLGALGVALISPGVFGADSATPADSATSGTAAGPGSGDTQTLPAGDTKPSPGAQVPEEIRKMIDAANKARADFVKKQQDLRSAFRAATREAREQIRAEMQAQREAFLALQRQEREDFRKRVVALREQLKQHQDAIDSAKDDAKPKGHIRKDG